MIVKFYCNCYNSDYTFRWFLMLQYITDEVYEIYLIFATNNIVMLISYPMDEILNQES